MAQLRHIAFIVEDPDASARFFEAAFGMKRTGEVRCGCHMSDGVVSIALLRKEYEEERIGIDHFGMWVDDLDQAQERALAAGAVAVGSIAAGSDASYEVKLRTPDGIVFDLSHSGWPGAVKLDS
jgi:lactoylglutathione lyase